MAKPTFHTDSFDADLCQNGKGGTWLGACACYNSEKRGGRYCDTVPQGACQTNADCSDSSYCHILKEKTTVCEKDAITQTEPQKCFTSGETKGVCYPLKGYGIARTNNGAFVLSDSILNKRQADNYCTALGQGWRTAARADFSCNSLGPGCLDFDTLTSIKKAFHTRGFFWLELELATNTPQNYYADIMDGTVYRTNADNGSTMQALCILKENL